MSGPSGVGFVTYKMRIGNESIVFFKLHMSTFPKQNYKTETNTNCHMGKRECSTENLSLEKELRGLMRPKVLFQLLRCAISARSKVLFNVI